MKKDTENKLLNKNTKPTSMRILVYDFLAAQKVALSLSEIEEQLHFADRITIYRTLKTFEEKGIIHGVQENSTTKYILCSDDCGEDTHKDWHLHFIVKCVSKPLVESILYSLKVWPGSLELMKFGFLPKAFAKTV